MKDGDEESIIQAFVNSKLSDTPGGTGVSIKVSKNKATHYDYRYVESSFDVKVYRLWHGDERDRDTSFNEDSRRFRPYRREW